MPRWRPLRHRIVAGEWPRARRAGRTSLAAEHSVALRHAPSLDTGEQRASPNDRHGKGTFVVAGSQHATMPRFFPLRQRRWRSAAVTRSPPVRRRPRPGRAPARHVAAGDHNAAASASAALAGRTALCCSGRSGCPLPAFEATCSTLRLGRQETELLYRCFAERCSVAVTALPERRDRLRKPQRRPGAPSLQLIGPATRRHWSTATGPTAHFGGALHQASRRERARRRVDLSLRRDLTIA